jgi:N-acetylglutamate synthase-like GNAT family acetyltransferase
MVGTVSLNMLGDLACVGRIAVTDAYRGQGLGARLLHTLEAEARQRGLRELWATARAPRFFLAQGYVLVTEGPERELLLSGCASCRQRDISCRPQAVRKIMSADDGDR